MSSGNKRTRRPKTAVYIKDGVILRSDDARTAKAEKDAEDVVREIMNDPAYKLGTNIVESGDESDESCTIPLIPPNNNREEIEKRTECNLSTGAKNKSLSRVQKLGPSSKDIEDQEKKAENDKPNIKDQEQKCENDQPQKLVGRTVEHSVGKSFQVKNVQGEILNKPLEKDGKYFHKGKAKPLVTGMKEEYTAKAEYSHTNAEASALNADVTGMHLEGTAEASAKQTQTHASVLKADFSGVKQGAAAHATYNHTTVGLKAASVKATGIDAKVTAEAKAKTGVAIDIGNFEVTGAGNLGVEANVDARTGVAVGNVRAGVQGKTGVNINTRPAFFNVNAVIGPPSFNIGLDTGMNIGIPFMGGGSSGDTEGTGGMDGTHPGQDNNKENSEQTTGASTGENQGSGRNQDGRSTGCAGNQGGSSMGNVGNHGGGSIGCSGSQGSGPTGGEGYQDSGSIGGEGYHSFKSTEGAGNHGGESKGNGAYQAVGSSAGGNQRGASNESGANLNVGSSGGGINHGGGGSIGNGVIGGATNQDEKGSVNVQFTGLQNNAEPQGNGYWTQFSEDGDLFWVSLEENNSNPGSDNTGMRFDYGEDIEFYDADVDPISSVQSQNPKGKSGEGSMAKSRNVHSTYESNKPTTSKGLNSSSHSTPSHQNEKARTTQGNSILPQIPSSPFLVQQNNLNTGNGTKGKSKGLNHSKSKETKQGNSKQPHKYDLNLNPGNDGQTGQVGDKYDHLLVNIVEREVRPKVTKKKKSEEKKDKGPMTPEVLTRNIVKERLVAKFKPQVQNASGSGTSSFDINGMTNKLKSKGTAGNDSNDERTHSRAKSAKKGKAFGDNKNIHGFHTLGTTSNKSLKKLGSNVYGFGS